MTLESICPSCGEPSHGVCERCLARGRTIRAIPRFLSIQVCPTCSDHFFKGRWINEDTNGAVAKAVEEALKIDPDKAAFTIVLNQISPTIIHAHVEINVSEARGSYESFDVDVRVNRVACDRCSRISGGYYESKVQIRADHRTPERTELDRALELAATTIELAQRTDRLAFIAKTIWLREGIDLYVGTVKAAKRIARALLREMGGTLSDSAKLTGRRDGKDVYRVTFVVRLPKFPIGTIILSRQHVYEICSTISTTNAVDLETGHRTALNAEELRTAELVGARSDGKRTVLVAIDADEVHLLDPETYATLTIKKPPYVSKEDEGKEVKVVKTQEGIFILP
ncbi:MAG: 60S ribosomal export protein NMD3 [Halobacteriota archaeon]